MILVVGPGALGTLLAASLARAGRAVTLLDRDPERARALSASPLRVETEHEAFEAAVPVVAELAAVPGPVEVAFLCVKTGATEAALRSMRGAGEATIAVLQNGCERARVVGELSDPARVVGVVTSQGATRLGPGRVRHAGSGPTLVGPLQPASEARAEGVLALLEEAGWEARLADVRQASWAKLLVNAALNALTGLLDCPNGRIAELPDAASVADAAAAEVCALARALGVSGSWDPQEAAAAWRRVALHTSANISSTLQDLRRLQTTEVHAINGAVARLAADEGLAAPVNDLLCRLVTAREGVIRDRA